MNLILAAAAGLMLAGGLVGLVWGLTTAPAPKRAKAHPAGPGIWARSDRRTRILAVVGAVVGLLVAIWTGWLLALVVVPAVAVGLPFLLSPPDAATNIGKLEALEEWTRALSGVLTAGRGLEQAITATLRSTSDPIRPQVTALVSRLNARGDTETALRRFADDLGDDVGGVGDIIAAYLILASRRRAGGLASLMDDLASAVADEVRAYRAIEADRAKPRATARWVTLITMVVLGALSLSGDYITPYKSPLGQLLLAVLLAAYVALLLWMRQMAKGEPAARFIGLSVAERSKEATA